MMGSSSSLCRVEERLPPGFRFHPRDDELICDYLMKKISSSLSSSNSSSSSCQSVTNTPQLIEIDLNKCEPWDIPRQECVGGKDWYFYSQRDRKYATGLRTNRATISGYWKATGKDRPVIRKKTLVGMRKTLVFYQGRAPKGKKTEWVMHEFRLEGPNGPPKLSSSIKEDWVLCRVFNKNKDQLFCLQAAAAPKQEVISTNNMGLITGFYCNDPENETNSFSSLPPLMEPYNGNVTFDQITNANHNNATTSTTNNYDHEQEVQVPCFSIFTPGLTGPTLFTHQQAEYYLPNRFVPTFGSLPEPGLSAAWLAADKKGIRGAVAKAMDIKGSSPSFGEGNSSDQSYLSDVGFSASMWNHY